MAINGSTGTLISGRRARTFLALLVAAMMSAGAVSNAAADPAVSARSKATQSGDTQRDWRLAASNDGVVLVWRSQSRLPMGDARPEFRLGGELLGYPNLSADGRTLRLETSDLPDDLSALSVWLSGRRLDGPTPSDRPAAAPYVEPTGQRVLSVDPGQPGPYETATLDYELPPRRFPGYRAPVEMVGHVVAPVDAPGSRPFVLFLHGRHYTCYTPGTQQISGNWPCHRDELPVPSHLGYQYAQRLLATQGYVTVSIAANGINAQDWRDDDGGAATRSLLVRRHLALWADWTASGQAPTQLRGPVAQADLDQVLLVGHSRGGEGVDRAAIDTSSNAPWDIVGQVLIGPTAFGRQEAPYVPTVVVLPYCDGDVVDLQGQAYVDVGRDVLPDPALRSSVLTMGANHNYFNTQWTPRIAEAPSFDDWFDQDDPTCGRGSEPRLTAKEQRAVGRTYVAGAARLLIDGDERLLPMYDGSKVQVPSAGGADIRTTALGGRRHLVRPGHNASAVAAGAGQAVLCIGRSEGRPERLCGRQFPSWRTPHWPGAYRGEVVPADRALEFAWEAAGASGGLALTTPGNFTRAASLFARVVMDPSRGPARLDVRIEDAAGRSVVLTPRRHGRLRPLPGRNPLGKLWAQTLQVSLADVGDVDLAQVQRIDLVARSQSGRLWLLDLAGRRPGLAPLPDRQAARVDLGRVTVDEGDGSSDGVMQVPVTVRGVLTRPARLSVQVVDFTAESGELPPPYVLRLAPGQQQASIPVSYERDDLDDYDSTEYSVVAFPVRGAMTGDYLGVGRVRDDDPTPTATWTPVDQDVTEGEPATWRLRLEKPVDYWLDYLVRPVPAGAGRQPLATGDVPRRWLRRHGVNPPDTPIALAATKLRLYVYVREGRRSVQVEVPTVADARDERTEVLVLQVGRSVTLPEPQTAEVLVRDQAERPAGR